MRRAFVVAALVLCAPGLARGQTGTPVTFTFNDQVPSPDSVYTAQTGGPFFVTPYYPSLTNGLGAYTLRMYYDTSRVAYDSARTMCADSSTSPLTATAPPNSTYVSLMGARCQAAASGNVPMLWLHLKTTAIGGSLLFLDPVQILDHTGTNRTADKQGAIVQVCHATGIWGDMDGNGQISSRDALFVLSAAVGLPTPGFFVSRGDVDDDGQITSRDALIILSNAIGLSTPSTRIGTGIADACAPRTARARHFKSGRSGPTPGQAGSSGLVVRAGPGDTLGTIVGDSAPGIIAYGSYYWRARVSPADSSVLFVCLNNALEPNICHSAFDGSGPIRVTTGAALDWAPDWSPDGTQTVFVRNGHIYYISPAGGPIQVPGDTTSPVGAAGRITSISWQPVTGSHRIAYTTSANNGEVHTIAWDTAGSDVRLVASVGTTVYNFLSVDWTPAGDSLAFDGFFDGTRAVLGVPDSAAGSPRVPVKLVSVYLYSHAENTLTEQAIRTDQGIAFVTSNGSNYDILLRRPDGSVARITDDPGFDSFSPGMKRTP